MSTPRRDSRRQLVVTTLAVVLAVIATVVVMPAPAAAQDGDATLRIRKANQLIHRSELGFETSGLAAETDFALTQCPSIAETDCVLLGEGTTDANGKIRGTFEARRELFVGDVRSDCAAIDCVVIYEDDDNRFVQGIDFLDDYPMANMFAEPLSSLSAGDTVTATANAYRPSTRDVDNTITICPESDIDWDACTGLASIAPSETVSFEVPDSIDVFGQTYDCAASGQRCYLRIGAYEARWNLTFTPGVVKDVLKWGSRKDLRNGEAVQVQVTSSTTDLTIVQCAKPKGQKRFCEPANTTSSNIAKANRATTQTLTAEVRRYMYRNGARVDCGAVRCDLEVRGDDGERLIGKRVRIRFHPSGETPEPTIKVPRKKVAPEAKVRVTLRNMPEATSYVVWQCVAGTDGCTQIHKAKLRKANLRKKVTVGAEIDGFDCTGKRGKCTIVVTTTGPETIRLEAPLKVG